MVVILAATFILAVVVPAAAKNKPDFQHFVTEPDFTAVTIDVLKNERVDEQAPGHIFLAPYKGHDGFGPQIFDTAGNLVWFGGDGVKRRAIDLHPCLYNSTVYNHLCYNDAVPYEQGGHSSGLIRFFGDNYTQVGADFGSVGGLRAPDIHELNTPLATKGKTFLQDIFQVRPWDLTPYKGAKDGYILDGCFQEIDTLSHDIVFQWCSLDHTDIDITNVYLWGFGNSTIPGLAGNGRKNSPWDYFHINSVDKSSSGDYIVSSRHANSIIHVAGLENKNGFKPGEVIWYLGGKKNSFEIQDFNFTRQHTIRYHKEETESGMEITLLNNAYDGYNQSASMSSGMLISLDTQQMRASLISRFLQPSGLLARDQGNLQMLPNGNALMGWGHCNYFSEHDATGKLLYYAQFGGKGDCDKVSKKESFFVSSFRAWKFPWKGNPLSAPKISAFSKECSSQMAVFLSWNGATEVDSWIIYASNSSDAEQDSDSFTQVSKVPKDGFETKAHVQFSLYVFAQPLDKGNQRMQTSPVSKAYVPRKDAKCDKAGCMNEHPAATEKDSIAENCMRDHKVQFLNDPSDIMKFKFNRYGVEGAVLVGLCLPFAVVYSLAIWSRNRLVFGHRSSMEQMRAPNVPPKPDL